MKKSEFGHLAGAIGSMPKDIMPAPSLSVSARVDSYGLGGDKSFRKQELVRLRKDIAVVQKEIANWNSEKVAAQALKSLKTDLAVKKARLMESEALAGEGDDEGKSDKKDSKKKEDAEAEKGVPPEKVLPGGEVDGGPYGIRKSGPKWKVITLDGGKVHGTFPSRESALKQFRLLEMKYHAGD